MSWRAAPLYVVCHDVATWTLGRTGRWPERGRSVGLAVDAAVLELLEQVALALTFPATRQQHLRQADEALARLRVVLRLARDLDLLSPSGLRHVSSDLRTAGRMLGGWRKRVGQGDSPLSQDVDPHWRGTRGARR